MADSAHVDVTLSREDHHRVQPAAAASGDTVAAWVRRAILGALEPHLEHQQESVAPQELTALTDEIRAAFRAVVECIAVAEAVAGKATPEQRERFADQLLELYGPQTNPSLFMPYCGTRPSRRTGPSGPLLPSRRGT